MIDCMEDKTASLGRDPNAQICNGSLLRESVAGFGGGRHFSKICIEPCVLSTKNLVTALSISIQAINDLQAWHDTGIMIHKDGTGMVI
jgi:hypothetical protein